MALLPGGSGGSGSSAAALCSRVVVLVEFVRELAMWWAAVWQSSKWFQKLQPKSANLETAPAVVPRAAWTALLVATVVAISTVATDDDDGVATLTVSGQVGAIEGVGYYHYGRRLDGMAAFVNVSSHARQ